LVWRFPFFSVLFVVLPFLSCLLCCFVFWAVIICGMENEKLNRVMRPTSVFNFVPAGSSVLRSRESKICSLSPSTFFFFPFLRPRQDVNLYGCPAEVWHSPASCGSSCSLDIDAPKHRILPPRPPRYLSRRISLTIVASAKSPFDFLVL
ncbi:unnamed protein product, partial [Pylaiella littoralis]